jgi:hypothetical protein
VVVAVAVDAFTFWSSKPWLQLWERQELLSFLLASPWKKGHIHCLTAGEIISSTLYRNLVHNGLAFPSHKIIHLSITLITLL